MPRRAHSTGRCVFDRPLPTNPTCPSTALLTCPARRRQELERAYESAADTAARAQEELAAMKRAEKQELLNKVVHLQHEAELGQIGIRELGERLVAVEKAVGVGGAEAGNGEPTPKAGGPGNVAKERGSLSESRQRASGSNSQTGGRHSQRLEALSAPSGPSAAAAYHTALERRRVRVASNGVGAEHAAESTAGREVVVIRKGGGSRVGSKDGRVVAVVKQPSKRWNSMLGCYPASAVV